MTYTSSTQPLCVYCGKPIPKRTQHHYVHDPGQPGSTPLRTSVEGPLYSKADCQRKVNTQVVSLHYSTPMTWVSGEMKPTGRRHIIRFSTWDGESYEDQFFCGGTCVDRFAYVMARAGRCTNLYNEAMAQRAA